MNWPHLHLIVNHAPVMGVVAGTIFFLIAAILRRRMLQRAALVLVVVAAVFTIPAYVSGTRAEEGVEHLAGVDEALIERHEDPAKLALIGGLALGLLALVGLGLSRGGRPVPGWMTAVLLVVGIGVSGLLAVVANLGGEIRHPEIRAGAAIAGMDAEGGAAEAGGAESGETEDD